MSVYITSCLSQWFFFFILLKKKGQFCNRKIQEFVFCIKWAYKYHSCLEGQIVPLSPGYCKIPMV